MNRCLLTRYGSQARGAKQDKREVRSEQVASPGHSLVSKRERRRPEEERLAMGLATTVEGRAALQSATARRVLFSRRSAVSAQRTGREGCVGE